MRSSIAIAAAGLISVASAGHHDHALFHKRHHNETCSTVWSTWYGEPTMIPLPPPPTSTSTSASSTSVAVQAPTPHKLLAVAPSPSPAPAPAPAPASGVDFFGHDLGSSGMNGITYTPYYGADRSSSGCKTASQIASDIQAIHAAGFNRIRTYATDCALLSAIGPVTQQLGMRLILGIFPTSPGSADSDFAGQLADIKQFVQSGGGSNVDALLVANEPLFGGHATVGQVASYLQQAKAALPQLKISVALTHPEVLSYGSQLCQYMDVLAAQIHPFFSSSYCSPGNAGDYIESEMALMSAACNGLPVFVSESGYPSGGGTYLSQIAGVSEQQTAISSIRQAAKANHITLFSSSDDSWKAAPGVQAYETMFNCLNLF